MAADSQPTAAIICRRTLYKVTYGEELFKTSASSNGRMAFVSYNPKERSVKSVKAVECKEVSKDPCTFTKLTPRKK